MQRLGLAAASLVCVAGAAHADGGLDDPPTPFDRGHIGFSVGAGELSTLGYNYLSVGAGVGYFVLDGVEIGLSAVHEFGGGPSINEVSPSLRYVARPLVRTWPVIPYAAVFYNHWFLDSGYRDVDAIGGRAGLLRLSGRMVIGLGIAYEHTISTCTSCDSVYPDVTLGFTF